MDQALKLLVEAAERDDRVPRVAILTASATVFGLPISSTEYLLRARSNMVEASMKGTRVRRKDRADALAAAEAGIDDEVRSFGRGLGPESNAISLGNVSFFVPASGETVTPGVLRVPLAAIDAWFTGGFDSRRASAGFLVGAGVSVPLGD